MKFLPYCLLSCLLHLITPVAHAELNWEFAIETKSYVVNPSDSFSVHGRITNFASSTSVLSISESNYELCPICVTPTPASLLIGGDETLFDVFSIDTSRINDVLSGLRLNPGESFDFTAYTLSPISSTVPLGNYEISVNDLALFPFGFQSGGPVHITVVPEPSASMLMITGLGIFGLVIRSRKVYA